MKIEIEIADELFRRLSYNMANDDYSSPELVPPRVGEIIERYGNRPKLLEPKHEAAMAILRNDAMARAVQVSKPGDGSWNVEKMAEALLEAVLGRS